MPGKADEITIGAKQHILDVLPLEHEPIMHQNVRILRPKKERPLVETERPEEPRELEPGLDAEAEPDAEPDVPPLGSGLVYGRPPAEKDAGDEGEDGGEGADEGETEEKSEQ